MAGSIADDDESRKTEFSSAFDDFRAAVNIEDFVFKLSIEFFDAASWLLFCYVSTFLLKS